MARPLSRHTLFITERTAPKSEERQRNSGLLEHAVTPEVVSHSCPHNLAVPTCFINVYLTFQDKEELQEFFKASQSPPDTAIADGTGKVQELESEVAAMAKEIRVNALYNKIEQDPKSAKVVWHQLEELDASYEDFEHPVSISMLANAQAIDDMDVLL